MQYSDTKVAEELRLRLLVCAHMFVCLRVCVHVHPEWPLITK